MRSAVAVAAAGLALVAAAAAAPAPGDVPTRDCRSRIESGRGPMPFETSGRVVAGRLSFATLTQETVEAQIRRRGSDGRYVVKAGVSVKAGRPVIVSVPERYRDRLFLRYTRGNAETDSVRFVPCAPRTRAFSYDGVVGAVTGFSGAIAFTRHGCYPLDVRFEGGRQHRVRIALGRPCR